MPLEKSSVKANPNSKANHIYKDSLLQMSLGAYQSPGVSDSCRCPSHSSYTGLGHYCRPCLGLQTQARH